jgi:DNA-binding NtrC family response regulator
MTTRILVADDDPVQRRLLDAMIRRFGYEPVLADGGEAALRLLEGKDGPGIGCVILDLVMPDLDGMGVLSRLKERGIDTPVIVQTAHGSIDAVISAMRAGAVDFVVKPAAGFRSLRNALAGCARGQCPPAPGPARSASTFARSPLMRSSSPRRPPPIFRY